tara:strand:+ start:442 stop:690 length:249 start_codon:yes stop_codon:yes gene_type:complete
MNLQLVIALVMITETGTIQPKSYFINPSHCEWVVQEISRERKYFKGFKEGTIFCRPEWVDPNSVKITRLNVIPLPEVDENAE